MALSNNPPRLSFPKTEIPGWLFFFIFVTLASVRAKAASADSDADDALSDFTNDLFTDLGPLLALFGEQMTKQYISESTTFYDYFIFGMGPIGIITTIVSTIRLCGPTSLRAFIGRSQEGNSAVEAELCTSTSRDVCEVFNNGGITRVLGRPKILELIQNHSLGAALPLAAKQGWFEAVDALLDIGVDPLAEDEAGRTALGYCAEYAQFEHEVCAEIILSYGIALEASTSTSWSADDGRTPLLLAIAHGNDEMVKILLKRGFPVVQQGAGNVSPLTEAFSRGFEGIALQLVDAGTELRREHLALAKLDNSLQSLAVACLKAQVEELREHWFQQMLEIIVDNDSTALQLLFNLGVEVEFGHVVLAIRTGHHEVTQLFLDGFQDWVNANPYWTERGLRRLEENNDHDIMQILLDHGGAAVWDGTKPEFSPGSSIPISSSEEI
ncbi:Ankyrin-2 [Colletotrichum siamense]|uniref:Ankyrin-2 n=1 Tax=Colletotrichum siamense TaxID=690259 RepID=A0A9P5EUC4_COLSI|nr:Ankyrin-2 [Colletotrichum siamense]KAF4859749.1 Ankyrin-2 [Colletotrichum siamense]